MFAFLLAAALAAQSTSSQSPKDFATDLEEARALSAQLDDGSTVGMLVLMKLTNEADNVCPLGPDAIDAWIKRNRLTELEGFVMQSLCESYWAGRHDAYHELNDKMGAER